MSPRLSAIVLFAAVTAVAGESAHAAALTPNLSIRMTGINVGLAPGRDPNLGYGSGPHPAPPYYYGSPQSRGGFTSTQFDGTVSFGSGGSGTKPPKKPNLQ
jgi:hypothetical protein